MNPPALVQHNARLHGHGEGAAPIRTACGGRQCALLERVPSGQRFNLAAIRTTNDERRMTKDITLPEAYDLLAEQAEDRIRRRLNGVEVSCRPGCCACCRQLVVVSPLEAFALASWVAERGQRERKLRGGTGSTKS